MRVLSRVLVPAVTMVTLGITHGTNLFMDNATMEIEPMYTGIAQLVGTLMAIDSGACDEE